MLEFAVLAIICAIIIVYLRGVNSELSLLATICAGVLMLTYALNYLSDTITLINKIVELTGIDKKVYVIIFKITAIGYIVEFSAATIRDFGLNSIADKLVFVGKLIIFSLSMPIIYGVLNLLIEVLQ
ncbi:MAG: hypothetical protein E7346_03340 [Clostridiales bacterium]|nr:hypothetical protein [Clostridiales bacterium]